MSLLDDFVCGKAESQAFVDALKNDPEIREEIRDLIPLEVRTDPEHPIWRRRSYELYNTKYGFDCLKLMESLFRLDCSIGDMFNIESELGTFYVLRHPDVKASTRFKDLFNFCLDVSRDIYEGPEVNGFLEAVLNEYSDIRPKALRIRLAKERIKKEFHVEGNHYPRWIQGPEWPMGKSSPMKFVKSVHKKGSDLVEFIFEDVDTGDIRVVEEFY